MYRIKAVSHKSDFTAFLCKKGEDMIRIRSPT